MLAGTEPASLCGLWLRTRSSSIGPKAEHRVSWSFPAQVFVVRAGPFLDVQQCHQRIAGFAEVQAGDPGGLADPVVDGVLVQSIRLAHSATSSDASK